MRKFNFFLALGLLMASLCANAGTKQVYSIFLQDSKTLLFYYNDQYEYQSPSQHPELYLGTTARRFAGYETQVLTIAIDESMKDASPTSWAYLFYAGGEGSTEYHLKNVTSITGLQNIKTNNATNLAGMFNGLESIESIDISFFQMGNVKDVKWLFGACKKLKTVNLGNMIISSITNTGSMFYDCAALEKIYCTADFSASTALINSSYMFHNCSKLVGGNGTKYNSSYTNKAYARPDRGTTAPGYFSFPDAVQNVINLIYAIGTVEYTTDCNQKIVAASNAWAKLTKEQQTLIAEDKKVLDQAQETYFGYYAKDRIAYYGDQNSNAYYFAQNRGYTEVYQIGKTNEPNIIACYNSVVPGTTSTSDAESKIEEAKGYYLQTASAFINALKDDVKTSIDALAREGDSEACKAIINNAKQQVNDFIWDFDETTIKNTQAFDNQFSQDWFLQVKADLQNQRDTEAAIKAEKEKLYAAILDLSTMKIFAHDYLSDNDLVTEINNCIIAAQVVYDNSNATLADVQTAVKNANDAIADFKEEMLPKAKAGFKAGLNGLLQPGDNQKCQDIVAAAVAQVDVLIVWDDTKNATQNILNLVQIAEKLYNDTKAAVEAARTSTNFDAVQQSAIRNQKVIRNGQLLIIRDGKTFNAAGAEL